MSDAAASEGGDLSSDYTAPEDHEMSDISISSDYHDWPYVVRPSGDKGLGAFATRDVAPGEIVLVDYTSIFMVDSDITRECAEIVELYEYLDPDEQEKWEALAATANERLTTVIRRVYSRPKPDGTSFSEVQQEKYTMLKLQFSCNAFDMLKGRSALFLEASRFNHSCDPNLWYDVDTMDNRWVGRATRRISKGEEIFVSYIPENRPLDVRRNSLRGWGFICTCPRCTEATDTYSASLEIARDMANGVEPNRERLPPVYGNTNEAIGARIDKNIAILRDIHKKQGELSEDKSIQKELVFTLMNGGDFHRHQYSTCSRLGNMEAAEEYLNTYVGYIRETKALADSIWPKTHELLKYIATDVTKAEDRLAAWEDKKAAYLRGEG